LSNDEGRQMKFIFKEIDENGETVNLYSLEDANSLSNKLKPQKK
jgi:hypothetical protein